VGGNGALNPDGTLADPAGLIISGVVSEKATLKIIYNDGAGEAEINGHAFPVGARPLDDQVMVNGHLLKDHLRSPPDAVSFANPHHTMMNVVEFDIAYLKFPHRTPGSISPEVQNGITNVLTIIPNLEVFGGSSPSPSTIQCGSEQRDPGPLGFATIEFKAMAPIVLVHGIRAGPSSDPNQANWFDPYTFVPGVPTLYQNGWFRKPFDEAKAPYSVLTFDEDTIEDGAKRLRAPIQQVAASFGSRYIHMVAHSKGGLWSRAFLANELSSLSLRHWECTL